MDAGEQLQAGGSADASAVPLAMSSCGLATAKPRKAERARWVLQGLGGACDDTPAKPNEPERATDSKEARRRERGSVRRSTRTRRADEPGTLTAATKPRRAADEALGAARGDGARRGDRTTGATSGAAKKPRRAADEALGAARGDGARRGDREKEGKRRGERRLFTGETR